MGGLFRTDLFLNCVGYFLHIVSTNVVFLCIWPVSLDEKNVYDDTENGANVRSDNGHPKPVIVSVAKNASTPASS